MGLRQGCERDDAVDQRAEPTGGRECDQRRQILGPFGGRTCDRTARSDLPREQLRQVTGDGEVAPALGEQRQRRPEGQSADRIGDDVEARAERAQVDPRPVDRLMSAETEDEIAIGAEETAVTCAP